MVKVGIIIPDRNDRPLFLKNCLDIISRQSIQPTIVELVNYVPESNNIDITQRYRRGYDNLRNKGLDIIAFMENDEWYADNYLETMVNEWIKLGKPKMIGTNYTIYYHIKLNAYFTMQHFTRSSAMSTLIKPDLDIKWCEDEQPYTDLWLWKHIGGITFEPKKIICLGIKHGIGKCGGMAHIDKLHRYVNLDEKKDYLRSIVDEKSFNLYENIFNTPI